MLPSANPFYQRPENRVGDQRREWSPYDVWLRFIPWRQARVRAGKVRYLGRRWRSNDLEATYNEHMTKSSKTRGTLTIEFKRVGSYADRLLWRAAEGRIGELELVEEDKLMLGVLTWKQLDLRDVDDRMQEVGTEPKARRNRSLLQQKAQKQISEVEKARQAAAATSFHGPTVKQARIDTQARRDAQRLADLRAAQETSKEPLHGAAAAQPGVDDATGAFADSFHTSPTEQAYDDDLQARLFEMARTQSPPARQ